MMLQGEGVVSLSDVVLSNHHLCCFEGPVSVICVFETNCSSSSTPRCAEVDKALISSAVSLKRDS